jgi:hypothetical protein
MRTASKLWLVAALALAATALAAGPAFATTITPAGDARGVGPMNINNGVISITCQSSEMIVNFAENGDTTLFESFASFSDCTEDVSGATCTFVLDGTPQPATTTYVSANRGELALVGPPFFGFDIDCGTLVCRADADERLRGDVIGGEGSRIVLLQPAAHDQRRYRLRSRARR